MHHDFVGCYRSLSLPPLPCKMILHTSICCMEIVELVVDSVDVVQILDCCEYVVGRILAHCKFVVPLYEFVVVIVFALGFHQLVFAPLLGFPPLPADALCTGEDPREDKAHGYPLW